ncbi:hypothetical protein AVEN_6662-1 [Araneus ventricosus]|uniref:Endonuclease/exonuclease/phosphatase domain-containing protein n=1 Tax=Araneus ventricosus TaxID=182803 RepID=A0A4Y2JWD4_ARAVE|nr:hypothetical protein AVEN_6662-1 [Araneus ventricosus]
MAFLLVLQINVNNSRAAHSVAFETAEAQNGDFVCVQDPYLIDGVSLGDALGSPVFSSERYNSSIYCLNSNLKFSFKNNTLNSVTILVYFNNFPTNLSNLYFHPHDNIDDLILEILSIGADNFCNLLVGNFNARSHIWGYDFEDHLGRIISEFISTNNFTICTRTDLGPTFVSSAGHDFPDLTLISTAHQHLLDSWWIVDSESLSDHRLVCVRLAGDFSPPQDFILKSKFSLNKFSGLFKKDYVFLKNLYKSVSSQEGIDFFYDSI